jgi:hypothetical protein
MSLAFFKLVRTRAVGTHRTSLQYDERSLDSQVDHRLVNFDLTISGVYFEVAAAHVREDDFLRPARQSTV